MASPLVRFPRNEIYRGFPQRLHHKVPHWVEPGAFFHVRVALDREKAQNPFNKSSVGESDFGFSKIVRSQDAMVHHALSFDGLITYMRCYLSGAMDR